MTVKTPSAPGLVIAAQASGQGKTLVTLALLRALRQSGKRVTSFKVGPDYIDPAFHAAASGAPCYNLDPWAMPDGLLQSLAGRVGADGDMVVCEGVMGLFDGAMTGRGSTADLAALLGWPVVLVVSAQSVGASVAAVVRGFDSHRDDITIAGVIFNQVGSDRHRAMVVDAMTDALPHIPVLACLPRLDNLHLPDRHLGLVQASEHPALERFIDGAASVLADRLDLGALVDLAKPAFVSLDQNSKAAIRPLGQRIAIARDDAFAFCYNHLLAGWRAAGAELCFFSPLNNEAADESADAIYLPGGYPELHLEKLSAAEKFLSGLRGAAESQKTIYGECGGYMVLGQTIRDAQGQAHPMAGLLALETSMENRKRHLGYRRVQLLADGPLGHGETILRGHEFHYARVLAEGPGQPLFQISDAAGQDLGTAGLQSGSVCGSFMHAIATEAP